MTIELNDLLVVLYLALIVFVIVLIVLGIKLIKTLKKLDGTIDDVNEKLSKLDGTFNIIDATSEFATSISSKVINAITSIFKKEKGTDKDE